MKNAEPALTECSVRGAIAGWPRLRRVAVEEVRRATYHHSGRECRGTRYWVFKHTLAGAGEVDLGDGWRSLPAGRAFLARRGDPALRYRFPPAASEPWLFWYCTFDADDSLVEGLRAAMGSVFVPGSRDLDLARLRSFAIPGCRHLPLTAALSARLVHGLLAALLEEAQAPAASEGDLVDATLALCRDPAHPPPVQSLAQALRVSREHLSRVAHQRLGMSLQRYLQHRRMGHACELLSHPAATVSAVARSLGFDTASHFARAFRQVVGESPRVMMGVDRSLKQ